MTGGRGSAAQKRWEEEAEGGEEEDGRMKGCDGFVMAAGFGVSVFWISFFSNAIRIV